MREQKGKQRRRKRLRDKKRKRMEKERKEGRKEETAVLKWGNRDRCLLFRFQFN